MDYNKFCYYRSNPYHKDGGIPPIGHTNRKKPSYLTEIPQGDDHFQQHKGRKHYQDGFLVSNIQKEHLLESPEKFPYENRIALDKNYERSLNTIDIEGASSSTLVSPAIRNKWRAREDIIRRKENSSELQELEKIKATEQERRRTIAQQQYKKNQEMTELISGRPHRNPQITESQQKIIPSVLPEPQRRYLHNPEYQQTQPIRQYPAGMYYEQNQKKMMENSSSRQKFEVRQEQVPRYHSIDSSARREEIKPQQQYQSRQKRTPENLQESARYQLNQPQNHRQFRMQNPTNLSAESSIYLAGRNLMGY